MHRIRIVILVIVDLFPDCGMAQVSWTFLMVAYLLSSLESSCVCSGQCWLVTDHFGLEVINGVTICYLVLYCVTLSRSSYFKCYLLRFFSTRAIAMFVDVLIFSFNWTVLILTLLHIRGWFPFKVNKVRPIIRGWFPFKVNKVHPIIRGWFPFKVNKVHPIIRGWFPFKVNKVHPIIRGWFPFKVNKVHPIIRGWFPFKVNKVHPIIRGWFTFKVNKVHTIIRGWFPFKVNKVHPIIRGWFPFKVNKVHPIIRG